MSDIALPAQAGAPASQGAAIEQTRAAAEVAAAVSVARQFPRDMVRARGELETLTGSLTVAERAFYEVPNRGAGLSVHIARELARVWGNVDYGVRELHRDDDAGVSEMQAWAWDVETNVRSTRSFIQPHERMRRGSRVKLTDLSDIYLNNQNTAARAVRECIFTVLPGWFTADAEQRLRATLQSGGGVPFEERVQAAIGRLGEAGVTESQLTAKHGAVKTWDAKTLAALSRAFMAITQDGIASSEFYPEAPLVIEATP